MQVSRHHRRCPEHVCPVVCHVREELVRKSPFTSVRVVLCVSFHRFGARVDHDELVVLLFACEWYLFSPFALESLFENNVRPRTNIAADSFPPPSHVSV